MRRCLLAIAGLSMLSCAHLSPVAPRFVMVFEQKTAMCRIQVVHDRYSGSCWVGFRCLRQPFVVIAADPQVCTVTDPLRRSDH